METDALPNGLPDLGVLDARAVRVHHGLERAMGGFDPQRIAGPRAW